VGPADSGEPPTPGGPGYRWPRRARIRRGTEIRRILRQARRYRAGELDVFVTPAPADDPRFGTIVPKHRRRVVDRNLLRRRLRELGRLEVLPRLRAAERSLDVLVRARPGAYDLAFQELRTELIRLTERLCCDASPSD